MTVVLDTSVFIDGIFRYDEYRYEIAKETFRVIQSKFLDAIVPEVFKIELIEKIRELAFSVAHDTGCRAIDAYFIATAKFTNSIIITNDKTMAANAKKYGVEAYYLIEEFDSAIKRLKDSKLNR